MKILTVVGARPQFIKASAISRSITQFNNISKKQITEIIVHTGQHYDNNMSDIFFQELNIPVPAYNLEISGGSHAQMTGRMMESIESVVMKEQPDFILIYGDTNSTLAAALVAVKIHIPIVHIEAGLRSLNMKMPEEVNRILADRVSSILFCPTEAAVNNLKAEGITKNVFNVGDVMFDVSQYYKDIAKSQSNIATELGVRGKEFVLATCHRAENTDSPYRLKEILGAFSDIGKRVPLIFPIHPRTKKVIVDHGFSKYLENLIITAPLPFLDMIALQQDAIAVLTDSGGVQKEAFFYNTPCITLRDETEWSETVELGWNQVVGAERVSIVEAFNNKDSHKDIYQCNPYGDGFSANKMIQIMFDNS